MPGRISITAHAVAMGRAVGLPDLHDEVADRALGPVAGAVARRLRPLGESPGFSSLLRRLSIDLVGHAALRMAAIDLAVVQALRAGIRQMVIVGAGLDTRAWRLEALRDLPVLEIDLPGTQAVKRNRLRATRPLAAVRFESSDLATEPLNEVLGRAGHEQAVPTLWLWEAVSMYLPSTAVTTTLDVLSSRSAPASRLLMTYAQPGLVANSAIPRPLTRAVRLGFGAMAEPLETLLDDAEARALLEGSGFRVLSVTGSPDWAAQAGQRRGPDMFVTERLAIAERTP